LGLTHYDFHDYLETWWDQYREGGALAGQTPTNAEYGEALQRALEFSGTPPVTAAGYANAAAQQRGLYGLSESAFVPKIPEDIPM
jgi:hypothetical protein